MKISKYRPVLTSSQITHILFLCKKDLSQDSMSVISTLSPFMAKIENKGILPAYIMKEKPSLEESLGFVGLEPAIDFSEQRKKAFDKWLIDPASCTVDELELVNTHRYESDMMTPDEEQEFENSVSTIR